MAEEKKDKEIFSELSKLLIENYEVLESALTQFTRDIEILWKHLKNAIERLNFGLWRGYWSNRELEDLKKEDITTDLDLFMCKYTLGSIWKKYGGKNKDIAYLSISPQCLKEYRIKIINPRDYSIIADINVKNKTSEEIAQEIGKVIQKFEKGK